MFKNKFLKLALLFLISLALISGQAPIFSEEWVDIPAEDWTDIPAEDWTDIPAEDWTDIPAEEWVDTPAEEWTDAPTEEWTDAPTEEWTDAPTEEWTDAPAEEWVEYTEPEPVEVHEPFTAYNFYTGNVYLMNDENYSVIFRNVKKGNAFGTEQFVPSLEYIELSIIMDNIFSAAGNKLSFEQINTYLLDQKVEFLVAENQNRVKVVYMEFCK